MSSRSRLILAASAIVVSCAAVMGGFAYYPAIAPVPPPSLSEVQPGPSSPPLARHVVVIVLDGARADAFDALSSAGVAAPATSAPLRALRERAAMFRGQSDLLTISRPMYATLGSGASPRLHGVATNSREGAIPVDTVIAAARRASIEVVLRDDRTSWWWDLFAAPAEERTTTIAQTTARLRRPGRVLAYVHVLDADDAAHAHGAASPAYREALATDAAAILEVAAALDLSRDALIITSDHGHRDRGGHGGQEPEVVNVPLWLLGAGIRPGTYEAASLSDVAPTVAVLAGLSLPAHSEGRPLFEALALLPPAMELLAQRWVTQRWSLGNAVIGDMGGALLAPPASDGALTVAGAAALVRSTVSATAAAIGAKDNHERVYRALVMLPLLCGVIWALRRYRVRMLAVFLTLLGAALFYGIWAAIFPFSLSALRVKEEFYVHLALLATVATDAAAIVAWLIARKLRSPHLLVETGVAVMCLGALEIGALFALYGMGLASGLPPPEGFILPALALTRFTVGALLWGLIAPFFGRSASPTLLTPG